MFKKLFLTVLIITISTVYFNAQTLHFSSDGKTLAANWEIGYGNENVSQFILFDAASGKVKSTFNADANGLNDAIFNFSLGNQGLIVADRNGISVLKLTADNQIELEEFETEFGNYEKNLVGITPSTDGKIYYKVYSDELIGYDILSKKAIPGEAKKPVKKDSEFLALKGNLLVEYENTEQEQFLIIHNLATKKSQKIKLPYGFEKEKKVKFDVQFSENLERMAVQYEVDEEKSQISVWDLKNSSSIAIFSVASLKEKNANDFYPVETFAFSPDGKKLAVKIHERFDEDMENLLFLWDVATKKETLTAAKKYSVEEFAGDFIFSPDSKHLAVASQVILPASLALKIQILDANTGISIREF